jgi:hypothetical protein
MNMKRWIAFGMISVFLLAPAAPVPAAEDGTGEDGIPSTAVARLKIGKGTAWVRSGGSAEWEESPDNFPLVEKSRVSVPQGSEAEIQFRGSQSLHLQGGSEVDIRRLGEQEVSYRLRSGRAVLSLPKEDFAPVRITVPGNREVRVDTPGRYSLATDRGTTRFLVRAGEGAVTDEDGSPIPVQAGEEASIGEEIRISRAASAAPEPAPEATLTGPEADTGVPPAVAGELRQYGEWVPTPEYGYAWRPYAEDGWEPYYYGRWTWVSPYGWTWVGYEPWGWWPYHTGWWWPSPVYGWVWCPFNSFVSVHFAFGHSIFFGHHARFFPANVRFVGRDRFVRWVPSRPGERRSGFRSFARGDSRLARWDRPVERGSVRVRRDGGQPVAWEGRGGSPRVSTSGRGTGTRGSDSGFAHPSGPRVRDGGAVRSSGSPGGNSGITHPRSGNLGDGVPTVRRGRSSHPISGSGGRITGNLGNSGIHRGPGRSSAVSVPARRDGGRISREPARGGISRGSAGMGSRGASGAFRNAPVGGNRGSGGGFRGSSGGGSRGSGRNR